MTQWTYKVVKRMRGMDGKMFDFPTAGTFTSIEAAREYARRFATEQAGVVGAEFTVRSRSGKCSTGRGALVALFVAGGEERL